MYASLFVLSDFNLRRVLGEPALFEDLINDEPSKLKLVAHEGERYELDKAWHGLHFLLTGTADAGEPALSLLVSAREATELEGAGDDYGPPRIYFSDFARRAHQALSALDDDALADRYDPAKMMQLQIYPTVWDQPDEGPDWLLEQLGTLRECLEKASEHRFGVIVYLS